MLERLTERIWVFPYEEERDRPNLGYVRGDRWSLAVDAGHSADHLAAFYRELEAAGLPLPVLTVLTHWHWDHTFAMHAVHGLCLASVRTDRALRDFRERLDREGPAFFLAMHESIAREYTPGKPVVVVPADLTFTGEVHLDPGNCPVRVFQAESPHTEDAVLVHVPSEDFLFLGDADSGRFPTWERDPLLAARLAETIRQTGAGTCLYGHWRATPMQEVIEELIG